MLQVTLYFFYEKSDRRHKIPTARFEMTGKHKMIKWDIKPKWETETNQENVKIKSTQKIISKNN